MAIPIPIYQRLVGYRARWVFFKPERMFSVVPVRFFVFVREADKALLRIFIIRQPC
ncbi:MAG: hypothetical protein BWZ08_01210 [candidate division BRC1 bacterium ADurb.BinA292]|nr:MAG: hypothetical protein BWZ08_01210 [candidate division BRC1 bacterium ADurb.BinA292]